MRLNCVMQGDVLDRIRGIPNGRCRGVVTSPPYNLRNSTGNGMKAPCARGKWRKAALGNGYAGHDDAMPYEEYVAWQREVLSECMRVIEDDGAIFYNHKWRVQKGLIQDRADIVAGFPVRQVIIWRRSGGINFNPTFFVPTYEVVYLIAKPAFRMPNEVIGMGDVWDIPQERSNRHPAPFPVELAARCIRALNGGPVLDPFLGSGTTAIAAETLGCSWLGIERSQAYTRYARERIKRHRAQGGMFDGA